MENNMGLLDQLAGQVMGSLGSQQQDPVPHSGLMGGLLGMLEQSGGLPMLLQKLQQSGLQDQVASWVGTGENHTVSGDQIKDALGDDQVSDLARQAGIAPEHAATGLAQILPQLINQLTPGGSVPSDDLVAQGISLLKGKLFG
ncbi:MAG: YidB family protein [Massilia sp.]